MKTLTSILLLTLLGVSVWSAGDALASTDGARKFVEKVGSQALTVMDSNASAKTKQAKLKKIIHQHVDIDWIGKFVLGRYWREASDAQKKAYLKNYRGFIATTYAARFTEYTGGGFTIKHAEESRKGKYVVKMEIANGDKPLFVDYKIKKKGSGYKIYDLYVEGVSLITTQRSEFSSIVGSKGLDHLITQLGLKTSELTLSSAK